MKNSKNNLTPSSDGFLDTPETVFEQINKFGTYEIQPTAERADYFPAIAQGLPNGPTGKNKKRDNTKSKYKNTKEIWKKGNLNEQD